MTFTNVNLSDHDAKNLNSFNDNIDTAQDSLILRISKLYNNYKPLMDKLDEELLELTSEIIKKQRYTKAWFHLSDRQKLPDEAYSYFLNDPFYLNDVSYYQTIALLNHHGINSVFNNEAKNIYKDLSTYLQLKTDTTIIKQIENYQHYIGTYKHKEELIQIKQQADKLVYSHSDLGNETYDFYPTNDSLFNIGYRFGKLIRNENKEITGMIRSLGGYEPKKYTKIE